MTLTCCVDCGEPSTSTRCPQHQTNRKGTAKSRGYDWTWAKLSKRARIMSPLCCDCGSTHDLQGDHSPEAWARKAAGKPLRLQDIAIRCGACNRAAGAARGNLGPNRTKDQGEDPAQTTIQTPGEAKFGSHLGIILNMGGGEGL